jgi:hypothetical protein
MEAGTVFSYCVGEPWDQQAVLKALDAPVITNHQIGKNNLEKVFGLGKALSEKYSNSIRVRSQYVGADAAVSAKPLSLAKESSIRKR